MGRPLLFRPLALLSAGLLLCGCFEHGKTSAVGPSIRALDAMDGVASATWSVTGQNNVAFPSAPYGGLSNSSSKPYVTLNQTGNQTVQFFTTSSPTTAVASAQQALTDNDHFTAVAYGSPPAASALVLEDQTSASLAGPNERFINAASTTGSVDVFVFPTSQAQSRVATTLAPGAVSPTQTAGTAGYTALSGGAGAYTINVYAAGSDVTPIATTQLTMATTDNWSVYLIDPVTAGGPPTFVTVQDNLG